MLKILRDNIKYLSWILWVVILVFIAFVFVDFGGARLGGSGQQGAATVGEDRISLVDYQHEFQRMEDQYRQAFGERYTPEVATQLGLPMKALERLVSTRILLQEAERAGLAVSDEEIRREILEMPSFKNEQGAFVGADEYREFLRYQGYTPPQFEALVRDQLMVGKLTQILGQNVDISDARVEKTYRDEHEKASIRYLFVPAGRYQGRVTVSPAELAAYFEAHKEEYRLPVQRTVKYLLVDQAALAATLTVPDADLERYHREHPDEFRREEEVRARHILVAINDQRTESAAAERMATIQKRLGAGEDFAALAAEFSDDPGSKGRGGELGFFGRGRMIKEFEEAAFGGQIGARVGPVKTSFGLHLLEIEDRRPAGERPLAEAAAEIRAKLARERADKAAEARARELSARIRAEKLTTEAQISALADDQGVSLQSPPPFGREEAVAGIGRGTPFTAAAFDTKLGEVAAPVKIARGWAIPLVLAENPSRLPQQTEVEGRVRIACERERMAEMARQELAASRGALDAGKTLDEVAQTFGATVQTSAPFGPGSGVPGLQASEAVATAALALDVGATGGPFASGGGAVLFQVATRERFDPTAFAQAKAQVRERLESQELNQLLGALIAQRKIELDVQYDRQLLEQLGVLDQAGG